MKKIILATASVILLTTNLFGAKPETPTPAEGPSYGAKYISVSDAKTKFDAGVLFLDTRKPIQVTKERIKGAVRALYKEKGGNKQRVAKWDNAKDKLDMKNIPSDKSTEMVSYCNGSKCWRSYKTAVTLTNMGYTNVYWLRDGIPGWKKAGNPTE